MTEKLSKPGTSWTRLVAALRFDSLASADSAPHRRLARFELVAWAGSLLVLLFLRSRGLQVGWQALVYSLPYLLKALGSMLILGLACHLLHGLLSEGGLKGRLASLLRPGNLLWSLRASAASLAISFTYIWSKVSIPLLTTTLLDEQLWELDRTLHLGVSPTLMVVALFESKLVRTGLDHWYALWMLTSFAASGFAILCPTVRLRERLLTSSALLWLLGGWIYVAVPALGPCYSHARAFDSVRADMPRADATQRKLWRNYSLIVEGRKSRQLPSLNPSLGVAAVPSLHVGEHVLILLWCGSFAARLRWPLALGTLLTFLGSILTGWHYAIDGYLGALLAAFCWWLASRMSGKEQPEPSTRGATAHAGADSAVPAAAVAEAGAGESTAVTDQQGS